MSLPKFIKDHPLFWFAIALIIVLYIAAPQSGAVNDMRQIFHFIFGQLLGWFG